jgi:Ca2+-binding RTX toxin-like protein
MTGLQFLGIEAFDGGGGVVQGDDDDDVFDFSGFARVTNVASILGYDGDDVITGSRVADVIEGGNDQDLLTGLGGADVIFGGAGEDTLYGGAGDDRLDGKTGNDALYGGVGADTLVFLGVTAREDVYFGGSGVDTIFIATGRNPMTLSSLVVTDIERFDGSDWRIVGTGEGNVLDFSTFQTVENVGTVEGLNGDDRIVGAAWDDRFFGGQGNDTLDGGRGSDRATGGGGADVFRFVASTSGGGDVIEDFDASGNDVVRLESFGFGGAVGTAARLAAIEDATADVTGGARIDLAALGGSGAVLLAGLDKAEVSFTAEDFAFG